MYDGKVTRNNLWQRFGSVLGLAKREIGNGSGMDVIRTHCGASAGGVSDPSTAALVVTYSFGHSPQEMGFGRRPDCGVAAGGSLPPGPAFRDLMGAELNLITCHKVTVFPPGGPPGSTAGRMPAATHPHRPAKGRSGKRFCLMLSELNPQD